jgi:hypothetical protein
VVEHFLGKEEVKGSIPFNGSSRKNAGKRWQMMLIFIGSRRWERRLKISIASEKYL